jgi:hypothetical protein
MSESTPKPPTNKQLAKQVEDQAVAMTEKLDKVVESTNGALEDVHGKLDKLLEFISKKPGSMEPMEQSHGKGGDLKFDDEAKDATIVESRLQDVDSPEFKAKEAMMAFNEEPVTVMIHETSERDAQQLFDVSVNNLTVVFKRGETKTVRRKFVEQLARAKPVHYENQEYQRINGDVGVNYVAHRGLRFPFSVIEDRNPKGAAWIKAVLAQP